MPKVLICTRFFQSNWQAKFEKPHANSCCTDECFMCKTWQQRLKLSKSNLVTNYCKLRLQNGNTPILPKIFTKGVDWAVHHRFIIFFHKKSALVTTKCFCERNNTWSRTMRIIQVWSLDTIIHRIVQKVMQHGHHQDICSNQSHAWKATCWMRS